MLISFNACTASRRTANVDDDAALLRVLSTVMDREHALDRVLLVPRIGGRGPELWVTYGSPGPGFGAVIVQEASAKNAEVAPYDEFLSRDPFPETPPKVETNVVRGTIGRLRFWILGPDAESIAPAVERAIAVETSLAAESAFRLARLLHAEEQRIRLGEVRGILAQRPAHACLLVLPQVRAIASIDLDSGDAVIDAEFGEFFAGLKLRHRVSALFDVAHEDTGVFGRIVMHGRLRCGSEFDSIVTGLRRHVLGLATMPLILFTPGVEDSFR